MISNYIKKLCLKYNIFTGIIMGGIMGTNNSSEGAYESEDAEKPNSQLLEEIQEGVNQHEQELKKKQGDDEDMKVKIEAIKQDIETKTGELESKLSILQNGGGRWRKTSPNSLFKLYDRKSLNSLGLKWGLKNPKSYRHKKDLAVALKLLMHAKHGDVKTRKGLNQIAGSCNINYRKYKTKRGLERKLRKI